MFSDGTGNSQTSFELLEPGEEPDLSFGPKKGLIQGWRYTQFFWLHHLEPNVSTHGHC